MGFWGFGEQYVTERSDINTIVVLIFSFCFNHLIKKGSLGIKSQSQK